LLQTPNPSQEITLIAAVAENNAIGKNNQLLWHLPRDLRFFKEYTLGKVIVMGRLTFESVGRKPLPNRTNVILTHQVGYEAPGIIVVHSLAEAISRYSQEPEICICGGEAVYREAMGIATRLVITRVYCSPQADTYFPDISTSDWILESTDHHGPDEKNVYAMDFQFYARR
jgi:dihydrofolate reductase